MSDSPEESNRPTLFTWFVRGCGCLVFVGIILAVLLPAIARLQMENRPRNWCPNNLKQLALTMKMYADEDPRDFFPPLSPEIGRLSMDRAAIYPEYMPDPNPNLCPGDEDRAYLEELRDATDWTPELVDQFFDDNSYFYLGYLVTNDEEMEQFARVYADMLVAGMRMEGDFEFPESKGVGDLWRLRTGIERVLFTEAEASSGSDHRARAQVPLLIERIGNHGVDGGNVVYLDGHVEFIRYPGEWPMTEKTVRILNELDALQGTQP